MALNQPLAGYIGSWLGPLYIAYNVGPDTDGIGYQIENNGGHLQVYLVRDGERLEPAKTLIPNDFGVGLSELETAANLAMVQQNLQPYNSR